MIARGSRREPVVDSDLDAGMDTVRDVGVDEGMSRVRDIAPRHRAPTERSWWAEPRAESKKGVIGVNAPKAWHVRQVRMLGPVRATRTTSAGTVSLPPRPERLACPVDMTRRETQGPPSV